MSSLLPMPMSASASSSPSLMSAIASSPRRLALCCLLIFAAIFIYHNSPSVDASISRPGAALPGDQSQFQIDKATHNENHDHDQEAAVPPPPKARPTEMADLPVNPPVGPVDYMAGRVTKVKKLSYAQQREKIAKLNQWTPSSANLHWPAWDDFRDQNYDPNRWEGLAWETDFYAEVGVRDIQKDTGLKPEAYLPYPDYNTPTWKSQWAGEYNACEGPRGRLLNDSVEDMVFAYRAVPEEFPASTIGSAAVLGLDRDVCFDRFNRYGAYGLGQTGSGGPSDWHKPEDRPEWSSVWWGQLQDACLERNKDRFLPIAREATSIQPILEMPSDHDIYRTRNTIAHKGETARYHSRTALLIRTWEGYTYSENDLQTIRSLATELSLLSGGEYQVFLLVNVKDSKARIYRDPQAYQETLNRVVPRELRDISILWTERMCKKWYPEVGGWQVYWHQFMPVQWFAKTHPEFDYIWNWETDTRYTGNHYHFLEQIAQFARNMPRKNLWERNSRYYFPSYHGNYASFLADTDAAVADARAERMVQPVWGPQKYAESQVTYGPTPPMDYDEDDFKWGVNEDADLITLQPIWDPVLTSWTMKNKIWNFIPGKRPHFTGSDRQAKDYDDPLFAKMPRRAFINTVSRFSRRQLHAMHMENLAGRTMQSEMWPATVALQHGLKAVHAPHPTWTDRKWPGWYLEAVFNANGNESAAWSSRQDSVFAHDREASFRGWSWYYASWFPRILYRRWLGWAAVDVLGQVGGDAFENNGFQHAEFGHIGGNGRMCVPGMLLHPIKKVKQNDDGDNDFYHPTEKDLATAEQVQREVDEILGRKKKVTTTTDRARKGRGTGTNRGVIDDE